MIEHYPYILAGRKARHFLVFTDECGQNVEMAPSAESARQRSQEIIRRPAVSEVRLYLWVAERDVPQLMERIGK